MRGFFVSGDSVLSNNLPHIMNRVLNQPLLMDPKYAQTFFAGIASRIGIGQLQDIEGKIESREKLRIRAEGYEKSRSRDRQFELIDGVGVLPVDGTLVNKFGSVRPYSGMTGYDGILVRARQAFEDPEVKGVLLDNDTPGGDVAGCFDCTSSLKQMAADYKKPLWSLAYDMNCSAGQAIASAANRRLITTTGYAGSIGVIMAHTSMQKRLEEEGLDVTLIYAGAHKADGNPYSNLPEEVYSRFLEQTEKLRSEFAQIVAGNIGIPLEKVLATEALSYRGEDAVSAGLADEVVNGNDAVQIFSEYLSSQGRVLSLGVSMSTEADKKIASATNGSAEEAGTPNQSATVDESTLVNTAKSAERARIGAILNSEAATGREKLANHLATNTDLSAEDAIATLEASAIEMQQNAGKSALDLVMSDEEQPEIGADADLSEQGNDEVLSTVALFKEMNGLK